MKYEHQFGIMLLTFFAVMATGMLAASVVTCNWKNAVFSLVPFTLLWWATFEFTGTTLKGIYERIRTAIWKRSPKSEEGSTEP